MTDLMFEIRRPDEHTDCRWWPHHSPTMIYSRRLRDLFRLRFWIRCWACELKEGPYLTFKSAYTALSLMEANRPR